MNAETGSVVQHLRLSEGGRMVLCVGLLATFYFKDAHTRAVREAVSSCFEDYWQMCGPRLRWASEPLNHRWVEIQERPLPSPRESVLTSPEGQGWDFYYHGGNARDEASDFRISALGSASWKNDISLSHLSFSLPIAWFDDHFDRFSALVLEWSKVLQPLHGYAGYGLLDAHLSKSATENEPALFALAQRFPGLEVDYPINHALDTMGGIKGVNWLTVLARKWIDQLGGLSALKAQLGEDFEFLEYGGGVVIQAAQKPEIGDRNGNRWPEAYLKLNAVLRPIRANKTRPFHHYGPDRFDLEASRAWIARFDR